MPKGYFVRVHPSAKTRGPVLPEQLAELVVQGRLPESAQVSEDGVDWLTYEDLLGNGVSSPNEEAAAPTQGETVVGDVASPEEETVESSPAARKKKPAPLPKSQSVKKSSQRAVAAVTSAGVKTTRGLTQAVKGMSNAVDRLEDMAEHTTSEQPYSVFISYRRGRGAEIARWLTDRLEDTERRVYLDVDNSRAGDWQQGIAEAIGQAPSFVPIVTEGFFNTCENPNDIVRKEIELALQANKNVVPLLACDEPFPDGLPEEIDGLRLMNGVIYDHEHADRVFKKLCDMLIDPDSSWHKLNEGEPGPKRVLKVVALVIGLLVSASVYSVFRWGYGVDALSFPITLISQIGTAAFMYTGILTPVCLVAHGFIMAFTGATPERHYGGKRWWFVWLTYVPMVAIAATFVSMLVTAAASVGLSTVTWLASESGAHLSGYAARAQGGWVHGALLYGAALLSSVGSAYVAARLIIKTQAWRLAARNLGLKA